MRASAEPASQPQQQQQQQQQKRNSSSLDPRGFHAVHALAWRQAEAAAVTLDVRIRRSIQLIINFKKCHKTKSACGTRWAARPSMLELVFGRQKRRATTLKGASVCNYVLKLILNRDVRLFGRDVDVIVGGRHCFCHHRLKASIMISERIIQRIGEAPRPVPAGSQPRLRRCCFL